MMEILLFLSLLVGQLGRIQITSNTALYVHDVMIVAYILWNIRYIKNRKITSYQLGKPILMVVVVFILSLIGNMWRYQLSDVFIGILYSFRFITYFFLYLIIRYHSKGISYWCNWLYFLGIGYALLGFFQLFLYPNLRNLAYVGWDPHYFRLFSTLFDPNFVGLVFVLSFFLGLYLIQTYKKQKWLLAAGEGVLVVALLLTYSRSSFLAAIIGGCIYILLMKKWKLLLAIAIFGLGIFLVPALGGISTSAFRMWSVTARITNWQEGIQLFLQSPIIGYGFDMLRAVPRASAVSAYGYVSNSAGGLDNSLLFILATTGVLGFGAFAYLWTQIVKVGLRLQKLENVKTVYFASLGALFVHSLFVNSMFYPLIFVWFWIFIGTIEEKKDITSRS